MIGGMSANIIPFGSGPTAKFLEKRVKELAADSGNIRFQSFHVKERMDERNLNMRQVLECLRNGSRAGDPIKDEYGDWRLKLRMLVAGRRVQVVVAIKADPSPSSRQYSYRWRLPWQTVSTTTQKAVSIPFTLSMDMRSLKRQSAEALLFKTSMAYIRL